jgi:hypothetical protein
MLRIHSLGVAILAALMDADRNGERVRPGPVPRHDDDGPTPPRPPREARPGGSAGRASPHAGPSDP